MDFSLTPFLSSVSYTRHFFYLCETEEENLYDFGENYFKGARFITVRLSKRFALEVCYNIKEVIVVIFPYFLSFYIFNE